MSQDSHQHYPFSAIVGQDDMKLALILVAVQPKIGGVLIQGERGTAKTTTVRALPQILGKGVRVIELPLNATEDRVIGTLNVGQLMKSGEREFVPGVLAEAHGNILYVDEINLLEDHIIDLLLDSAATGVCHVEREGVSQTYPAQFVLVGTMNPEEGTLRPQLLDRFGLSVKVEGNLSGHQRLELLRRLRAFEDNEKAFCAQYADEEALYQQRITQAQNLYSQVDYPDALAAFAAALCNEIAVDGYRADLSIMRAARAHAALQARTKATEEDVLLAARFVLPHRMKRLPFEEVELSETALERAVLAAQSSQLLQQDFSVHLGDDADQQAGDGSKKATGQPPK